MLYNLFKFNKRNFLIKSIALAGILITCLVIGVYAISFILGPPKITSEQNTIYYSHDGTVIGEESDGDNRHWVGLENISKDVIDAAIAIEDKRFYEHGGFDVRRIMSAAFLDLQNLSLKEGASTITQQYARNLYLSHEKTWTRKLKEAFYTIRLEMYYSKDEILEGYLNMIYFGHGAYGIEAASMYFFNKSANELSLAEAAMLIAIPKGPTYYSPLNNLANAQERQKLILSLLLEQKKISKTDYVSAINEDLIYAKKDQLNKPFIGPYFHDVVLNEASEILKIDGEVIQSGGYEIHTTLHSDLQKGMEGNIKNRMGNDSNIEIGAIAMDHQTGAILALIGGRSYTRSPFNRAVSAKRMAGSTFKPFLYYTALENNYTASTKLMSKPTTFTLEDDETYQPGNFNGYYANSPITLAQALALSDNIYAVKTNLFLGAEKLADTAKEVGITSKLPLVPSLALGTASVSVKEMVVAYGILANGGRKIIGHTIEKIVDQNGVVVFQRNDKIGEQILDKVNTFILTHLMTGMFEQKLNGYMAVTGSTIVDQLTRPYAGKSGSTNSDSWMIGYSPTLVTGIWTGYDDNRPIEVVKEMSYAKEIWADFMETAHNKKPVAEFIAPKGVISMQIDPQTGQILTPYCPEGIEMYFKKGTEPKVHCMTHFPFGSEGIDVEGAEDDKNVLQRLFDLFR